MYVLGGYNGAATASVLKFDSTEGWVEVVPMPAPRYTFTASAIGSDIYVFGGRDGAHARATVFKFDTQTNEWIALAPMPHVCAYHSAEVLGGLVYIVGGGVSSRETLRFDPSSRVWQTLAPTSVSRRGGVSYVLGGRLYAAGGDGGSSSVECYDVASNTWSTAVSDMLEGRRFFGAVTIGAAAPAEEEDLFDSLIAKAALRELQN
jgi:hypothetical protein